MAEIAQGLKLFNDFGVTCVVVGGVAGNARGLSQATFDVDVCYSREPENLIKLVNALRSVNATLRGAPKDIPFRLDDVTLRRGLNFTFETDIGSIDILGEVQGVGGYEQCLEELCLKTELAWFVSFTPGFSQVSRDAKKVWKPFKRFPISTGIRNHPAKAGCE